jgi:hypothetical protein
VTRFEAFQDEDNMLFLSVTSTTGADDYEKLGLPAAGKGTTCLNDAQIELLGLLHVPGEVPTDMLIHLVSQGDHRRESSL